MTDELIGAKEAAAILGLSYETFRARAKHGRLPSLTIHGQEHTKHRRHRFRRADIEAIRNRSQLIGGDVIDSTEAARILGVTLHVVTNRACSGQIPTIDPGYTGCSDQHHFFRRTDVEAFRDSAVLLVPTGDPITIDKAMERLCLDKCTILAWADMGRLAAYRLPHKEVNGGCSTFFSSEEVERVRTEISNGAYGRVWRGSSVFAVPDDLYRISYLAGLFDGEGNMGIHRRSGRNYMLKVYIANTDPRVTDWLQDTFGGHLMTTIRQKPLWRDCHHWSLTNNAAAEMLRCIFPYLIIKREQADLAIEFQDHIRAFRANRWKRLDAEELEWREEIKSRISALIHTTYQSSRR